MRSTAVPLAAGSVAVAVAAAIAGWLVGAATLPYQVPVDAVAFLAVVVMLLTCGVGLLYAARRWPVETAAETAAGLVGPAFLGSVLLVGSTAPLWFRILALAAFVAAGALGLRAGNRETASPVRVRSEIGSGSLEFVGVVILAAVLVAAGVGAVASSSPAIKETVWAQICRITGGECPAGEAPSNTAYKPADCAIHTSDNSINANVDVAFVRLAGGGTVRRINKSNGEVEITLLNEGRAGGVVAAGGHGNVRFGEHSAGVDFEAEASATAGLQSGETYVFDNADQADAFQSYLQGELAQDAAGAVNPVAGGINWVVESVTDERAPDNAGVQKTYTRFDTTVTAKAEASAGFGTGVSVEGSYMQAFGSELDRGSDPDDPSDDQMTTFIQMDWKVAGNAGIPVVGGIDGSYASSGIVKLTTDAEGQPVQVQFLDRSEGGFQVGLQADESSTSPADGREAPKQSWGLDFKGGESSSTVVTRTLDLDSPERQRAFFDWMLAAGGTNIMATAGATNVPGVDSQSGDNVTSFGQGADAFDDLVSEQGSVSVVEYDGTTWGLGLGGGLSLGLKASADVAYEDKETTSTQAVYLGAPDADGDRTAYDLPECVG